MADTTNAPLDMGKITAFLQDEQLWDAKAVELAEIQEAPAMPVATEAPFQAQPGEPQVSGGLAEMQRLLGAPGITGVTQADAQPLTLPTPSGKGVGVGSQVGAPSSSPLATSPASQGDPNGLSKLVDLLARGVVR